MSYRGTYATWRFPPHRQLRSTCVCVPTSAFQLTRHQCETGIWTYSAAQNQSAHVKPLGFTTLLISKERLRRLETLWSSPCPWPCHKTQPISRFHIQDFRAILNKTNIYSDNDLLNTLHQIAVAPEDTLKTWHHFFWPLRIPSNSVWSEELSRVVPKVRKRGVSWAPIRICIRRRHLGHELIGWDINIFATVRLFPS